MVFANDKKNDSNDNMTWMLINKEDRRRVVNSLKAWIEIAKLWFDQVPNCSVLLAFLYSIVSH